jgi:hypothetical protein
MQALPRAHGNRPIAARAQERAKGRLHAGPRVSHAPAVRRRKIEEPSNFSAFVALTHANSDSIDGFHHATHVQMWDGICCAYAATSAMQPLSIGLVVEIGRNGRRHQRRDRGGQ